MPSVRYFSAGDERMRGWTYAPDDVLRRAEWTTRSEDTARAIRRLLFCVLAFGFLYGAVMGAFWGLTGQSQWLRQMFYSAVKVPLLLSVSFCISLPRFFVFSSLFGLRRDFAESVRSLLAAQAGLAIVLASLAPLTLLWYASSMVYAEALFVNGILFAVASAIAHFLLRSYYRPLIARNYRHRSLLTCWGAIYVLVAIQMA